MLNFDNSQLPEITYAHIRNSPVPTDFHNHDRFEIYFFVSGNINYFIENKIYKLQYGDMLIINNKEIHKPLKLSNDYYERIVVEFHPYLPSIFRTDTFDPLSCFVNRLTGEMNKLVLNKSEIEEVFTIFNKFERVTYEKPKGSPSSNMLKHAYLLELLDFVNNLFYKQNTQTQDASINQTLAPILDYIANNLDKKITLESLQKEFFISPTYLNQLFRKHLDTSVHKYIFTKRIVRAKTLLSEGYSVSEACAMSGFEDYSNFYRAFKRITGLSPREYGRNGISMFFK